MYEEHERKQRALIDHLGSAYAEACPGSGKTWVIIERYLRRVGEETRRGIGLLSFTNAAIDEISHRTRDNSRLLESPHFVGTFDSFLHRFVVTPGYLMKNARRPRYCESWSQLPSHEVRVQAVSCSLDDFDYDTTGEASVNWDRIPLRNQAATKTAEEDLCAKAARRYAGLTSAGLLSSDAARQLASRYLLDSDVGPAIRRRIAGRFAEIIVDEGQDCGRDEIEALNVFRAEDIVTFFVADPGQAIFEFRRSTPRLVATFAARLPAAGRLDGNRRSSPAICAIANSISSGSKVDIAIGSNASCKNPVYLIVSNVEEDIREAFLRLLTPLNEGSTDSIVLAHSAARAYKVAGIAEEKTRSRSQLLGIADAVTKLRSQSLPRARHDAIRRLEMVVLYAFGYSLGDRTVRGACEDGIVDARWLRRAAFQIAVSVPDPATSEPKAFREEFVKVLALIDQPAGSQRIDTRGKWPSPQNDVWASLGSQSASDGSRLKASTVHGVKGMEFAAVLLVLEKRLTKDDHGCTVLDSWENRKDSEPKRVIYVGATRAQRVLALAVTPGQVDQVTRVLERDDVPFEVVTAAVGGVSGCQLQMDFNG